MDINQAINLGVQKLQPLENPKLEAEVLLSAITGKSRTQLKTQSNSKLSFPQQLRYRWWLHRRAQGTPVAYIMGTVEWNGLQLKVNRHTLIPRDETETLCHHIIHNPSPCWGEPEGGQPGPPTILDIGTGSGCIAIWLAQKFPQSIVTALDISSSALKVAQHNARQYNLEIDFKHSDLLSALEKNSYYDLMVANLPYVPTDLVVTTEVAQEPSTAIFSGLDGLNHIRRLASELEQNSITFNQLWLEFLPSQQEAIRDLFSSYKVDFFPDVSGQIYFAQITRPA